MTNVQITTDADSHGMTAIDQTSERQDLAKRAEVKYAMTGVDIDKLRSHLAGNCRQLIHNNRVSIVRSIYFDDETLSACRANLNGISSRRKLRMRWYDSVTPKQDVYFEIKWRENRITGKHRLHVRSLEPLDQLSYSQINDRLWHAMPEEYRCQMIIAPDPVMIVQYDREHFSSDDGSLRVTLDYNLMFFDQMGRQSISTDFPCRMEDHAVIEGKVPVGRDADLRRLLYPYVPRANRCSKYVHGCRLLNHIHDAE
jgi:hypothetical protein